MTDPKHTEPGDLLPCPFCGGIACMVEHSLEATFGVECDVCQAQMHYVGLSKAEAIAAWNTRTAAEAASREEVEALQATIRTLQNDLQAHKDALAQWEGSHDPE